MKSLSSDNYIIRPFKTFKRHEYELEYLVSGSDSFSVYEAIKPPENWTWEGNAEPQNHNSIIFKRSLWKSVVSMFYSENPNQISSRAPAQFDRKFDARELDTFYVVAINQQAFGEKVKPETFRLTVDGSADHISDDGKGRLLFNGDDEHVVGNIFYEMGIAVIAYNEPPHIYTYFDDMDWGEF